MDLSPFPREQKMLLALWDFVVAWPRRSGPVPFLRIQIVFFLFPRECDATNMLALWVSQRPRGRTWWGLRPLCEFRLRGNAKKRRNILMLGAVCSWLDIGSDLRIYFAFPFCLAVNARPIRVVGPRS